MHRLVFVSLALLTAACGNSVGTALLVKVDLGGVPVEQLRFSATDEGRALFEPAVRPESAAGALTGEQTLRILLPDALGGRSVEVVVEGLSAGGVVAQAREAAVVERGREVAVALSLSPSSPGADAGLDAGPSAPDAGRLDGGVPDASEPGPDAGQSGEDAGAGADAGCGTGPACAAGQECVAGSCRCTTASCTGCCDVSGTCRTGLEDTACGSGGQPCSTCPATESCRTGSCTSCNASTCSTGCCSGATCLTLTAERCAAAGVACVACGPRADGCSAQGVCTCGGGALCPAGTRCAGSQCVCDASSCPSGCCKDGACQPLSPATCGLEGGSCSDCTVSSRANGCSGTTGTCVCGQGPVCEAGQRCDLGKCVCDATSCPSGCCDGSGVCRTPSKDHCGPAGGTCRDCTGVGDECRADGTCGCGGAAACAQGLSCSSGSCSCTATSCAGGCCAQGVCQPASLATCGTAGGMCSACEPRRANACGTDGSCRCGSSAQCAVGLRCDAGQCVCDPLTCPGCCGGNPSACLAGSAGNACGSGGGSCELCTEGSKKCSTAGACSSCTALTCPDGCCSGSCKARSLETCGTEGGVCVRCDPLRASACSNAGICVCGAGPACGTGQECVSNACRCTPASCPNGCCDGDVCRPGVTDALCGQSGAACTACTLPARCVGQSCR